MVAVQLSGNQAPADRVRRVLVVTRFLEHSVHVALLSQRGRAMLRVCQFPALIVQYTRARSSIISYFRFRFTAVYK